MRESRSLNSEENEDPYSSDNRLISQQSEGREGTLTHHDHNSAPVESIKEPNFKQGKPKNRNTVYTEH